MFKELNVDFMANMYFVGFFCVNNNKEIGHNNPQMMQCIFCYKILSMYLILKFRQEKD